MMNPKELIARRAALELVSGTVVNLGIGLPTLIANYVPEKISIILESENGLLGMGPRPLTGINNPDLTDAGGGFVTALPGAVVFDTSMSFGLIRGGHIDLTILGGLEVDSHGRLANWMIPGKLVPGMGGAMDLLNGAKKVIITMLHSSHGESKIVKECKLPLTSIRMVDLIITELAVIKPTDKGLVLLERAPGVTVEQIVAATEAELIINQDIPEMKIL